MDPATLKVVDLTLPDGTPLDPSREYTVVVNNYMYGNTKYGIGELSKDMEVGPEDLEATIAYVKTLQQPFDYKVEGRIQQAVVGANSQPTELKKAQ